MKLRVPLKRFIEFVHDAEKLDLEYPCLHQQQWLVDNFSFDDRSATYDPAAPMPWPVRVVSPKDGPYLSWWQRLARN